jgi:hypothetical protein
MFGFLLLLFVSASLASAQDTSAPASQEQELSVSDILKMPGKILGEGSNVRPSGKYKLTKFRLEQVDLPAAHQVEIGGKTVEVKQAFRLTLAGGPFPVRALPPVIWLDDVAVGYAVENEDLTEITVIFFDRALLREGASLYLSYGSKQDKTDRERVPEKLNMGGAKGGNQ